jgi:hypothetical protein
MKFHLHLTNILISGSRSELFIRMKFHFHLTNILISGARYSYGMYAPPLLFPEIPEECCNRSCDSDSQWEQAGLPEAATLPPSE